MLLQQLNCLEKKKQSLDLFFARIRVIKLEFI